MKTPTDVDTLAEMKAVLRDYFDKCLKPKKETIKNVDREILCYALEKAYQAGAAAKVTEMREMAEKYKKGIDVPRGEYGHYSVEGKIEEAIDDFLALLTSTNTK